MFQCLADFANLPLGEFVEERQLNYMLRDKVRVRQRLMVDEFVPSAKADFVFLGGTFPALTCRAIYIPPLRG